MRKINKTDEKAVIEEGQLYSVDNKRVTTFNSSVREYPKDVSSLNPEKLSDEELVRLFTRNGDEGAFNEIVNRYTDKIYGLVLRITRNPSDSEDVLQEVFITLIKKLDTFREESKFSSWLYRVAVNTTYMHLRSNKKYENELSLEDYAPYNENGILHGIKDKDWSSRPDKALLSKESLEIIERAVEELPEPYRVVFILRDIEGFSNREVAEIVKLSVPAMKSRLHRARLFLRDRLSDYLF